jgi:hypothetical protein
MFRWDTLSGRSNYGWYVCLYTALPVGGSGVRSSIVSLGIFSVTTDGTTCPGVDSESKMSTKILLVVKTAGA